MLWRFEIAFVQDLAACGSEASLERFVELACSFIAIESVFFR
jgi:hypothetical protein